MVLRTTMRHKRVLTSMNVPLIPIFVIKMPNVRINWVVTSAIAWADTKEMATHAIRNPAVKQPPRKHQHHHQHSAKMVITTTSHGKAVSISMSACSMQVKIFVVAILRWSASIYWAAMIVGVAAGSIAVDRTVIQIVLPDQQRNRQHPCHRNVNVATTSMTFNKDVPILMNAYNIQIFAVEMLNVLIGSAVTSARVAVDFIGAAQNAIQKLMIQRRIQPK